MTGRIAFVLLAGVAACQTDKASRVDFSEAPRAYVSRDYGDVYERWTRHDFVSHDAEKAIELWVTFKSWDFREAYIERYAATYSISDADRTALRQHEKNALHQAYEFHVTAQSANYKWNDLEKGSSPWRFVLMDALGHELQPESIRVEKLPEVVEKEFYPAKTPFTKAYNLRFVAPPNSEFAGVGSGTLVLRLSSPAGRVELSWRT